MLSGASGRPICKGGGHGRFGTAKGVTYWKSLGNTGLESVGWME